MNSAFMYFTQVSSSALNTAQLWRCTVCKCLVFDFDVLDHFSYHGIA